jgi:membrane protease YdiL (CAAX protease family)
MENETKPEAPPARLHFHLALASVFLPMMWLVIAAAAVSRKAAPSPLQSTWRKYLLALLAVDLLVFACYAWMIAHPDRLDRPARESERPRIGVGWDPDPAKTEARVNLLLPGSPAEKAGFRAGDLVEAIDGVPVTSKTQATELIRSGEAGVVRKFAVRRDGASVEIAVAAEKPAREARKLFDARPTELRASGKEILVGFLPPLVVMGIAALVSRFKRRLVVVTWRGFVAAMLGSFAAALGTTLLFRALQGGASVGAALVTLSAQMAALLGFTRLATVWCGRDVPPPADPVPPLPPVRAGLLGIYYLITAMARMRILTWTVDQLFFQGSASSQSQGVEVLATAGLGTWGTIFFVFVVAILGPLAEESLFRGFLVPRLAAMWGSLASMVVSALIFALFHPYHVVFLPVVFVYGFVFAWARLRTGSIAVPFVLHLAVNGLVSAMMLR